MRQRLLISLLLAVPFGTIVYLAIYGFFNRGGASATLSLLMLLKIVFAVCLVVAEQRFLQKTERAVKSLRFFHCGPV